MQEISFLDQYSTFSLAVLNFKLSSELLKVATTGKLLSSAWLPPSLLITLPALQTLQTPLMAQMMMTYDGGVGANKCSNDSIPARGRPAYSDTRTRHNPKQDDDNNIKRSTFPTATSSLATMQMQNSSKGV